jgi:lysophospholipase L1-like esterase
LKKLTSSIALKIILALSIMVNIYYTVKYINYRVWFLDHKHKMSNHTNIAYRNRVELYNSLPVSNKSIVFIGDSETQGYELTEFFDNALFINRGMGGDKSSNIIKRLDAIIKAQPAKIFLEVGINDIIQKVPLASFTSNMNLIVKNIKTGAPNTRLYLQGIFPTNWVSTANINAFNDTLRNIALKNSLTFIDLYTGFNDKGNLNRDFDAGDGLHLNYKGYQKWTAILKPYVN